MCDRVVWSELGRDEIRPEVLQYRIENRGLADANFARDDHEAVAVHQRESQVRHCPGMLGRHEDEARIRRQIKRPAGQSEVLLVHRGTIPPNGPKRASGVPRP